jgi:hypothetical protein
MRSCRSVLCVALALMLLVTGCTRSRRAGGGFLLPAVAGSVVVLDSSGVLAALAARDLRPQWRVDLGTRARAAAFSGSARHVLTVDEHGRVYVAAPPWLFVVDGGTGLLRAAVALPRDVDWGAPVVVSSGVYLAGADRSGAPMVALVNIASHQVTGTTMVRPGGGRSGSGAASPGAAPTRTWPVYATAAFAGGARLAVSYHGADTSGIDVVDLGELETVRCSGSLPGAECSTQVRGDVVGYAGGMVATTGLADLLLLDGHGQVTRVLDTGLGGSGSSGAAQRITEIAVDETGHVAYALGSCGYAGGLASVALPGGRARLLRVPATAGSAPAEPVLDAPVRRGRPAGASGSICGDRVLVAPGGSVLAVVNTRQVQTLDAGTGTSLASRAAAVPMTDAVMIP